MPFFPDRDCGFTLVELAVVLGAVGMLSILCVTAMAGAKGQSKIAVCADNIRQLVGASQIYANENQGLLPSVGPPSATVWPWDFPLRPAQALLNAGLQKKNFYCPGTEPRFTDWQNFQNPVLYGNLWDWDTDPFSGFHVIGYTLAYWGSTSSQYLFSTNRNKTIQPELIGTAGAYSMTPNSQRVLAADVILSTGNALPGYLHSENNYDNVVGGFSVHHLSSHLRGTVPAGHNLGFKDGHVEWRPFDSTALPRNPGPYPSFWW